MEDKDHQEVTRKPNEEDFSKNLLDADSDEEHDKNEVEEKSKGLETDIITGYDCQACRDTQYTCEHCGKTCCTMCAEYDGETEDRSRGHGNVRNHVVKDPRCITVQ